MGFASGNVTEEATDASASNQRQDELEPLSHEVGHGQSLSQKDGDDEAGFGATNHVIFASICIAGSWKSLTCR